MARSEQGGACRHLLGVQRRSPEQCRLRAAADPRIYPLAPVAERVRRNVCPTEERVAFPPKGDSPFGCGRTADDVSCCAFTPWVG